MYQAPVCRVLHRKKRRAIRCLTDVIDWDYVWMIESRNSLSFSTKTGQRLLRLCSISHNALKGYNASGAWLSSTINYAHPSPSYLAENLMPTNIPVSV